MINAKYKKIGPIESADITVGDLTILCGPNNSGKTYVSYSLYGYLKMFDALCRFSMKKSDKDAILENNFASIDLRYYASRIGTVVSGSNREFLTYLDTLFSVSEGTFKDTGIVVSSNSKIVVNDIEYDGKFSMSSTEEILVSKKKGSVGVSVTRINKNKEKGSGRVAVLMLEHIILNMLIKDYFPRSFIMSSERVVASLFHKQLDKPKDGWIGGVGHERYYGFFRLGAADTNLAPYSWPVRDNLAFIQDVANVTKRKSFLYTPEIMQIFQEISGGKYDIINDEVVYSVKGRKGDSSFTLPMHFASSSVKALTILYYYIFYYAQKGDFLLIDEPELNLHPDNQRKIARLLALLVNHGIKVLITTHSDYIVREINNLIMIGALKEDVKKKFVVENGYREKELLNIESVKAYVFSGNSVKMIPGDTDYGFSIEPFDEVINKMNSVFDSISMLQDESC